MHVSEKWETLNQGGAGPEGPEGRGGRCAPPWRERPFPLKFKASFLPAWQHTASLGLS